MRVTINLASEPFRQDRRLVAGAIAVSTVLLILLGLQIYLIRTQDSSLAQTRQEIAYKQARVVKLSRDESQLNNTLRMPDNAEVFDRSEFINGLLVTKGVSWTKTFADLSKVMPPNVKLISVRPQVFNGNQVRLEMELAAKSPDPIINFLMKLEASPVFGATQIYTSLPPTEREILYRYRVGVNYAQQL